jgi:hypothetical protein
VEWIKAMIFRSTSLFALFSAGGVWATQSPIDTTSNGGKCLSISGTFSKTSFDLCCPPNGSKSGRGTVDGIMFIYTCGIYGSSEPNPRAIVANARECAKLCAADANCPASSWNPRGKCYFAKPDYRLLPSGTIQFLLIEKTGLKEEEPEPVGGCGKPVEAAKAKCEEEATAKCEAEKAALGQTNGAECEKKISEKCSSTDAVAEEAKAQCEKEKAGLVDQKQCEAEKFAQSTSYEAAKAKLEAEKSAQSTVCEAATAKLEAENQYLQKALDEANKKNNNDLEVQVEIDRLKQRDEDHTKKANQDRETIEKLERDNKVFHDRLRNTAGIEPPNPETPRSEIPSEEEWKCPQIDGKEYTVLGVTYKVFCDVQPHGRTPYYNEWTHRDPLYMMAMCSVERNCQGISTLRSTAQMTIDYEFPPTYKPPYSGWWSIIPTKPRTLDQGPMVPDIFSRTTDNTGGSGVGRGTRCPDIDGETLTVGDRKFQVNCKKNYEPKNSTIYSNIGPLNQCLVLCAINDQCQGVSYGCRLIWKHEALPKNTRPSELGSSFSWVVMLVNP